MLVGYENSGDHPGEVRDYSDTYSQEGLVLRETIDGKKNGEVSPTVRSLAQYTSEEGWES